MLLYLIHKVFYDLCSFHLTPNADSKTHFRENDVLVNRILNFCDLKSEEYWWNRPRSGCTDISQYPYIAKKILFVVKMLQFGDITPDVFSKSRKSIILALNFQIPLFGEVLGQSHIFLALQLIQEDFLRELREESHQYSSLLRAPKFATKKCYTRICVGIPPYLYQ